MNHSKLLIIGLSILLGLGATRTSLAHTQALSFPLLTANKTPSNYDGSYTSLRPQEQLVNVEDLPLYNPRKDRAPKEQVKVEDTDFTFRENLQVRPETDHIVIHHVAIPSGDYSAEKIHHYHQSHNGWAGIGYHYVIRRNGLIQRGRPLTTIGAQAAGENLHSIGICMAGNFNEETVEPQQYQALVKLVANLVELYNLPLSGEIVGHRDYNDTSCPGDHLYDLLPRLRQDVRAQVGADQKARLAPTSKKALAIQKRAKEKAIKNQKMRLTKEAAQSKHTKSARSK